MKFRAAIASTILVLFAWTGLVSAGPLVVQNGNQADLFPENLTWSPKPAEQGDKITFTIFVANRGQGPLAAGETFGVSLAVDGPGPSAEPCQDSITLVGDLAPGGEAIQHVLACSITLEAAGDYALILDLDTGDQIDESGEENNRLEKSLSISALPDSINRLFAGLGLFAAMMAVLAVGTEVTIDTVRLILGMKRKPTSLEALKSLEDMLPGKLEALGAGAQAEQEFRDYVISMRSLLAPAGRVQGVWRQLSTGKFFEAIGELRTWWEESPSSSDAGRKLGRLFGERINQLKDDIGLSDELTNTLSEEVRKVADRFQIAGPRFDDAFGHALDAIFDTLQSQAAQITKDWLENHLNDLISKGPGYVLHAFDRQIQPELEGMGFSPEHTKQLRDWLEGALDTLDARALQGREIYFRSLEQLMKAVEIRRSEMQSPFRKLWRRLRNGRLGFPLNWFERLFNFGLGRQIERDPEVAVPTLTATTSAHYLLRRSNQQQDEEASRLRWLRVFSILVGIVLAYILGVDAALLLERAAPGIAQFINDFYIPPETLEAWLNPKLLLLLTGRETNPEIGREILIHVQDKLTAGMILSGLAASAGSAFWHDQLDRLQAAKKSAEQVARLAQTARKLGGAGEE